MSEQDLQLLKSSIDKLVRITCYDGEVIVAKVHFVFDEYQDVVIDLVSTNRESKYEKHDEQPAFAVDFRAIESVEAFPTSSEKRTSE
jgi:small nuclear ribonucleoprotein (snRNP)-like protein